MNDELEPAHVQEARRVIREWEQRDGHDAYVECLDGGFAGYQAVCSDCDWKGDEHLRGAEEIGTDESRAHKIAARHEAAAHRRDTRLLFDLDLTNSAFGV